MIEQDKQLLLKDLCARLPYGVKLYHKQGVLCNLKYVIPNIGTAYVGVNGSKFFKTILKNGQRTIYEYKPYLRPMSSMTEEEEVYYNTVYTTLKFYEKEDWLNAHHFDYRSLIEKSLAIVAPEGMYKND